MLGFGTAPCFLRFAEDEALPLSPDRYHFLDSAASRRSVPTALDLKLFAAMGYEP